MVALVALGLEGVMVTLRWSRYQYRYKYMLEQAQHSRSMSAQLRIQTVEIAERLMNSRWRIFPSDLELLRDRQMEAEDFEALSLWAENLVAKYDKARKKPWLDVPPDPIIQVNFYRRGTPW